MYQLKIFALALVIACGALSACAIPVRQIKLSQPMTEISGKHFVLASDARCGIGTGYGRVLRQGTRWELVGAIAQGDVYRSRDQTLTVEGYNVHEAYVVVQDDLLVGFYLPVEKTFTPVAKSVRLTMS